MNTIKRSEVEVSVRLTDNETSTLRVAMSGYAYEQDESGQWVKVITNATYADTYDRCYGNYRQSDLLVFTEADEAVIVLALTKFQAKAKADGDRSEQVRATRLLKKVVNAIDDKLERDNEACRNQWIRKARSLNKRREIVAAGYQPDTFQIVFNENSNRGVVTVEHWTEKALAERDVVDHWSSRYLYTHTTEIEVNFVIVDGAVTMTYTHRKGGWHDKTAVAHDTFDEALTDAKAYLELCAISHNERTAEDFETIIAELAELEQDEALVMQAKVVAEADAMLKENVAA